MRWACPGETVTYTCTVNQGTFLDWIVEPFINDSDPVRFSTAATAGTSFDCSGAAAVQCAEFNFVAMHSYKHYKLYNYSRKFHLNYGIHCYSQTEHDSGAVQRNCRSNSSNKQQYSLCCRYILVVIIFHVAYSS